MPCLSHLLGMCVQFCNPGDGCYKIVNELITCGGIVTALSMLYEIVSKVDSIIGLVNAAPADVTTLFRVVPRTNMRIWRR